MWRVAYESRFMYAPTGQGPRGAAARRKSNAGRSGMRQLPAGHERSGLDYHGWQWKNLERFAVATLQT